MTSDSLTNIELLRNKVDSFPGNRKVIEFLELNSDFLQPYAEHEDVYVYHEGLARFMKFSVPDSTKFVDTQHGNGFLIQQATGEIFAIHHGQYDIVFKVKQPIKDKGYLPTLRGTFLRDFNLKGAFSLRLNYWRNLKGDDVRDVRKLGVFWVVDLYFVGEVERKIVQAYELTWTRIGGEEERRINSL